MNGDETGVDCGGSSCPFCIPSCVTPNSDQQDCQLPTLSAVLPSSGPSEHAVLLTVHGSGFYKAGEVRCRNLNPPPVATTCSACGLARVSRPGGGRSSPTPNMFLASRCCSRTMRCRAAPS
eukprot:5651765-Prymnesium_polylepis.1